MIHKLYATAEYMEDVTKKLLKEKGELWTWANVGWHQKKELWQINGIRGYARKKYNPTGGNHEK